MGKRRKKFDKRKNFVAIPFQTSLALGTLASALVLSVGALAAFGEDIFIISVDIYAMLTNTAGGQGPIYLGLAHGDLTDVEIAEALDASLTDPDDIIAKERARRPVRRIGTFNALGGDEILNNGNPVRVPVRFTIGNEHVLDMFVQNRSGAALTTGSTLSVEGIIYGRWLR